MAYNKKAVLEGNTEAIRVILRLEKERREATEAEKVLLRGYQGFGGLKCVLNRCDNPDDLRYWSASEQNLFAPSPYFCTASFWRSLMPRTSPEGPSCTMIVNI